MKKQYQKPDIKVVRIDTENSLMQASNQYDGDSLPLNFSKMSEGDGSDAAAKSFSLWDDEEDDDE